MVSVAHSDLIIVIARGTAIGIVALVCVLILYIFFLRALLLLRQQQHQRFIEKWRPILRDVKDGAAHRLPRIRFADRLSFMILWNQVWEEVGENAAVREWLGTVATNTGMNIVAARWLTKRSLRKRLLVVVMLGHLRDRRSWETLRAMANSDHPLLSLVAVQALARINPQAAARIVVPLIARRVDWPRAKVASILNDIGPGLVSKPLVEEIGKALPEELPRLLPYLETCQPEIVLPVVRRLARELPDGKVIGPCLSVIGKFRDKDDRTMVREFLVHTRWHVRAHAATCLGKIGSKDDEERLLAMLADRQWWVRYRAAQALRDLPSVSYERLCRVKGALKDSYARDILEQVMAEKSLV